MKKSILIISTFLTTIFVSHAQTAIYPESPEYNFSAYVPFKAEYSQMGMSMLVITTKSADNIGYNVSMTMPDMINPSRVITDVIGMKAKDAAFSYRNFHLLQPSRYYMQVESKDTLISLIRSNEKEIRKSSIETNDKGCFDGTFVYWLLGGINYTKTKSFKMNTWKYTPQGLAIGLTPIFTNEGKASISINGANYHCNKIVVSPAPGVQLISYVAEKAPYLIKQEYVQGDNKAMTIIELKKVLE